jgi:type I restriction enzyme R subunit
LSEIYEILSPDSFLRPYIEEFETLARMYRIVKEAYEPGISVDREFTRKTAKLVQEHTKSGMIRSSLDTYEIDENTIKNAMIYGTVLASFNVEDFSLNKLSKVSKEEIEKRKEKIRESVIF